MNTVDDVIRFVERQPDMMRLLALVEGLGLPDCWIGGGFLRNAVWDALHPVSHRRSGDVDVVWFDHSETRAERDAEIEGVLRAMRPDVCWDVKNQARMHHRSAQATCLNTEDAVARWPETATALAVRRRFGRIEMIAPHGVGDLLGLVARPTPAFRSRVDVVVQRIETKGWRARWPKLQVVLGSE